MCTSPEAVVINVLPIYRANIVSHFVIFREKLLEEVNRWTLHDVSRQHIVNTDSCEARIVEIIGCTVILTELFVVSSLAVPCGAGMAVNNTWGKIVEIFMRFAELHLVQ